MSVTFEVVDDPAHACAALMVGAASADGHIVLSGGSTPKAAYGHFVEAVTSVGLDLSRTTLWVGDERCVEPDDDRSNDKMIRESLLEPLAAASVAVPAYRRMLGELGPQQGAADYDQALRDAGGEDGFQFDLMLLGIGPDGHTLSLFPGQPAVSTTDRLVVGVPEAGHEPFVARISMTLAAVGLAKHVVLLASGESKAEALAEAFGRGVDPDGSIPASLLPTVASDLIVLIDEAAGSQLGDLIEGS